MDQAQIITASNTRQTFWTLESVYTYIPASSKVVGLNESLIGVQITTILFVILHVALHRSNKAHRGMLKRLLLILQSGWRKDTSVSDAFLPQYNLNQQVTWLLNSPTICGTYCKFVLLKNVRFVCVHNLHLNLNFWRSLSPNMEFAPPQAGLENIEGPDGVGDLTVTLKHGTAARSQWLSSSCLLSLSLALSCRRSRSKQRLRCRPHEQNRNILTFDLAAWRQQWYTVGVWASVFS